MDPNAHMTSSLLDLGQKLHGTGEDGRHFTEKEVNEAAREEAEEKKKLKGYIDPNGFRETRDILFSWLDHVQSEAVHSDEVFEWAMQIRESFDKLGEELSTTPIMGTEAQLEEARKELAAKELETYRPEGTPAPNKAKPYKDAPKLLQREGLYPDARPLKVKQY